MLRALRTAALGMSAQQAGVDNIANNLANVNTNGYKRSTIVFHDLLYQTVQAAGQGEAGGGAQPASLQMGHGAAAIATVRNFTQGSFSETGNSLDLAINGEGFLQVLRPDGSIAYTRDGSFTLSADGAVVTQTGLALDPDLSIPAEAIEIHISQDGVVAVRVQGEPEMVEVGQIELARFSNPSGLNPLGGNLFEQTAASGEPSIGMAGQEGLGVIRQGFLEASNVDVVKEMVDLIMAQRAYEINSKMVTTSDDMLQIANSLKR